MQLSVYVSHFVGGMPISREMHSEAFVSGRLDGVAFEETRLLLGRSGDIWHGRDRAALQQLRCRTGEKEKIS
jgi:hypothetical protein